MSETKWACRCGFINTTADFARVCGACGDARTLAPATPPTPESDAHREVRESVVCEKCYGLTSCWCPPTPDLDAVREALVSALLLLGPTTPFFRLADVLGVPASERWSEAVADALLAAVSRPAEARGEPDVDDAFILAVEEEVGMGNGAWDMVKASDLCRAVLKVAAAPRPETGEVSEAMVEAGARALHDGLESGVPWDDLFPSMQDVNRKASRDVLRAALAAQREPKP